MYGGFIDTNFVVFLPGPWFVPLHLLPTWWSPQGICYGHIILKIFRVETIWCHFMALRSSNTIVLYVTAQKRIQQEAK